MADRQVENRRSRQADSQESKAPDKHGGIRAGSRTSREASGRVVTQAERQAARQACGQARCIVAGGRGGADLARARWPYRG